MAKKKTKRLRLGTRIRFQTLRFGGKQTYEGIIEGYREDDYDVATKLYGTFRVKESEILGTCGAQPLDVQVGGSHYKLYAIQPIEYCQRNRLGFCESNVVKYVTRHRLKGGAEDIKKAIHNLQVLLQLEYSNAADQEEIGQDHQKEDGHKETRLASK